MLAYGVEFPGSSFPAVDAASTIAPFTVVTLAFFSGVWIPIAQLPHWLEEVSPRLPLFHLAVGLQSTLSQ